MALLPHTRILVTNDDGIHAPGLAVLEHIARALSDDVWVAAPETEQSGVAHSLTLHTPVRVRKVEDKRYAISGTPTDCVLLALKEIIKDKPVSFVLSGVNRGSNAGDDVTYSGTVAGALEGAMLGVRSIALSQLYEDPEQIHWETAQTLAPALIKQLLALQWEQNILMNINFPDCAPADVKGTRSCRQGKRLVNIALTQRLDPKARPYYWLGGDRDHATGSQDSDVDFLHSGYVTVTPLMLDLTSYTMLEGLRSLDA